MSEPIKQRHLRNLAAPVVVAACLTLTAGEAEASHAAAVETDVVQQIQRYCASSWRNASIPQQEWSDCSQQVFAELLQRVARPKLARAMADPKSDERRELNRSIWRIAKRCLRAMRHLPLGSWDLPDPASELADDSMDVPVEALVEAAERLTPRQSRILRMLSEGSTVAQIAQQLNVPAARVSDEKYRAIQKIRQELHLEG